MTDQDRVNALDRLEDETLHAVVRAQDKGLGKDEVAAELRRIADLIETEN